MTYSPPGRLCFLKAPQPPEIAPPTGDHVFRRVCLWTFLFKLQCSLPSICHTNVVVTSNHEKLDKELKSKGIEMSGGGEVG